MVNNATPMYDVSGLKLSIDREYSLKDIYLAEAQNIAKAMLKYLSAPPTKKVAPFSYAWMQHLHEEMFGDVWDWAGKFRQTELSIGIKAYLVATEVKKLCDDIEYWDKHKVFDIYEIATRLHHRAVQIHPFVNGNGRWARMLASIYMRQRGLMPVKWQDDLLAKENPKRNKYIQALKKADKHDYTDLIKMHKITY